MKICGEKLKFFKLEWKVTTLIWRGSNFCFFAVLYCSSLDLMPCMQARGYNELQKAWLTAINCIGAKNGCCFKVVSFIYWFFHFYIVNIERGPTTTSCASYSMGSCPLTDEWMNEWMNFMFSAVTKLSSFSRVRLFE